MPGRRFHQIQSAALFLLCAGAIGLQTNFQAPPRFDGAGYAVLAEALRTGRGYAAIDHPDAPAHAHFPPGYPVTLALIWTVTGPRMDAAHALSLVCTALAVVLMHRWLRGRLPRAVAFLLACALAINWTWLRTGGAIQSEPVFLMLTGLSLCAGDWSLRGQAWRGMVLGIFLAATTLTRHVGVTLVAALALQLWLDRRRGHLAAMLASFAIAMAPWLIWLAIHREATQVGLLPRSGVFGIIAENALFYVRRIPDAIVGPVIEAATVYRPGLAIPATMFALGVTALVGFGWVAFMRSSRRRLLGLVPLVTLAALLVWPFTEAGRFLIPLVPFVLAGAWNGIDAGLGRFRARTPVRSRTIRRSVALLLFLVSMPYTIVSGLKPRVPLETTADADFEAACRWITSFHNAAGPVMVRQAGEAFWLMDRSLACVPPPEDPSAIPALIKRYQIAYLIDDQGRYTNAPIGSIARYVQSRSADVRAVWSSETVRVYAPAGENSD